MPNEDTTAPLPADHPPVKPRKVGVVIANLGTPDATDYWSMRRYLSEFLSDKRVVDYSAWLWQPLLQLVILTRRPFKSGEAYASIWNTEADESPLLTITRSQADALRDRMQMAFGEQVEVAFCMRYGNPSTASVVNEMIEAGCDRVLFLPLYPQYAGATWATANDQFFRAMMTAKWQPAVRTVAPYFDDPEYIETLCASLEEGLQDKSPDVLLLSYHGMPQRYLEEGDPYHCQCQKTTRLVSDRLALGDTRVMTSFQSVFGREEWLRPYTVEEVARLAKEDGVRHLAIAAPAFASDCVETLEEIEEEIRDAFIEAGGEEFTYIPCLNDSPRHIDMLETLVRRNLEGWIS